MISSGQDDENAFAIASIAPILKGTEFGVACRLNGEVNLKIAAIVEHDGARYASHPRELLNAMVSNGREANDSSAAANGCGRKRGEARKVCSIHRGRF